MAGAVGPESVELLENRFHVSRAREILEVVPYELVETRASNGRDLPRSRDDLFIDGQGDVHNLHRLRAHTIRVNERARRPQYRSLSTCPALVMAPGVGQNCLHPGKAEREHS